MPWRYSWGIRSTMLASAAQREPGGESQAGDRLELFGRRRVRARGKRLECVHHFHRHGHVAFDQLRDARAACDAAEEVDALDRLAARLRRGIDERLVHFGG